MRLAGFELHHDKRVVEMLEDGQRNVPVECLRLEDETGTVIARIEWHALSGEILHLWVQTGLRRQGLATRLYRRAQLMTHDFLQHSEWRTTDGEAWAQSLGEQLPKWVLA